MFTDKEDSGQRFTTVTDKEIQSRNCEWSKNTTKHKELNYMSSCSRPVGDDWLKNGTPYHDSDTFVEP